MQAILKAKESVLLGDTVGLCQSLDAMADNILLLKSTVAKMHGMKCLGSNCSLRQVARGVVPCKLMIHFDLFRVYNRSLSCLGTPVYSATVLAI